MAGPDTRSEPDTRSDPHSRGILGVFDPILQEFGTNATQLSILIPLLVGSVGLEYVNPGTSLVAVILSLSLVYMFRQHIPAHLPKAAVYAIVLFLSLGALLAAVSHLPLQPPGRLNAAFFSACVSAVIMIPIALVISSYRKQRRPLDGDYPDAIRKAIDAQLTNNLFYKDDVEYDIKFIDVGPEYVTLETVMTYTVVNRDNQGHGWTAGFNVDNVDDAQLRVCDFRWGKEERIRFDDPRFLTKNGFTFTKTVEPRESVVVYLRAQARYRLRDSELYTTYCPAGKLTVKITPPVQHLQISCEPYYLGHGVTPTTESNGEISVAIPHGVLPYEGVRVKWY